MLPLLPLLLLAAMVVCGGVGWARGGVSCLLRRLVCLLRVLHRLKCLLHLLLLQLRVEEVRGDEGGACCCHHQGRAG